MTQPLRALCTHAPRCALIFATLRHCALEPSTLGMYLLMLSWSFQLVIIIWNWLWKDRYLLYICSTMAHLLRVVPRTTSLLTPLVRPCVSVSFFHSPACSSLSFSANYPQITPSQITKEIIHAPLFNEGVIQFGKYDAGDDPDGDKLSKVCIYF